MQKISRHSDYIVFHYSFLFSLVLCALFVAGCKKEAPPAAPVVAPASSAGSISLTAPGQAKAGPAPTAVAAPDMATMDRPLDAKGNPLSDLEILNQMVESLRMKAGVSGAPAMVNGRKPQGPVEEAAAMAESATGAASIKDINDLVKAGLIKAIPAAPAGKKYVYDPKTTKIIMANQ